MSMKRLTVNDLLRLCQQAVNEGNGYHGLFYGFTLVTESFDDLIYDSQTNSIDDTIILG